jgi:hypothetical protein
MMVSIRNYQSGVSGFIRGDDALLSNACRKTEMTGCEMKTAAIARSITRCAFVIAPSKWRGKHHRMSANFFGGLFRGRAGLN